MSTMKIPAYNFDDQREIMRRPSYTRSGRELFVIPNFWSNIRLNLTCFRYLIWTSKFRSFLRFLFISWWFWNPSLEGAIRPRHLIASPHLFLKLNFMMNKKKKENFGLAFKCLINGCMIVNDEWMNGWASLNWNEPVWTGFNLLVQFAGLYCGVYETSFDVSVLVYDPFLRLNIIQRSFWFTFDLLWPQEFVQPYSTHCHHKMSCWNKLPWI